MSSIELVVNGRGNFDLRNFGQSVSGPSGKKPFDLIIEDPMTGLSLQFQDITVAQIFTRFSFGEHFGDDRYYVTNFVSVSRRRDGTMILEPKTHQLFKGLMKAAADGRLINNSSCKVDFQKGGMSFSATQRLLNKSA
jgi:hypothetical protein